MFFLPSGRTDLYVALGRKLSGATFVEGAMKLRILDLAAILFALVLVGVVLTGCDGAEDMPVASRIPTLTGPDVTIDVKPVGRAEKFKTVAKPQKFTAVVTPERHRRRRRVSRPIASAPSKPKIAKHEATKKPLPPDEDYYPVPKATEDFDPGEYRVPDGE